MAIRIQIIDFLLRPARGVKLDLVAKKGNLMRGKSDTKSSQVIRILAVE